MNPEHTTQRVLVMEWVNGQRLRSRAEALGEGKGFRNTDDLKLIDIGVRCSLEQMLEEGFYHRWQRFPIAASPTRYKTSNAPASNA